MDEERIISALIDRRDQEGINRAETLRILQEEYQLDQEQALLLYKEIRSEEIDRDVNHSNEPLFSKLTNHIGFSYFFLIFALGATIYSIIVLTTEQDREMNRFLPWVILAGCLFLFFKHGKRILQK